MSGAIRLRQIFANTASKSSLKPKTTASKPSVTASKPSAKSKPHDYSTPHGLQKIVDNFKKSCKNEQFRRKVPLYHTIVHHLARAKAFPMIEDILESQKQYKDDMTEEGFVIRLITLYGKAGMVDHARKLFDEMPSFNCHRSVKSLTALLKAFITAKKYDVVEDLFRELSSKYSIELDVISYNVVIHALCQLGSTDSALSMLRQMEELGLKPNCITFCTLLSALYVLPPPQHGYSEGEKIWARMQAQHNLRPDVACYAAKINGMFVNGRVAEAVKLVDEMIVNGVEPDARVFNILINGFCKDGKVEEAKYWYGVMVKSCNANHMTYMTLVPFLVEKGDFEMAFKLCREGISGKMSGRRLLINAHVLKRVVEGFAAKGMNDEAKELVDFAKKKTKVKIKIN